MNCEVKFSVSKIENDNNNDIKGKTIKLFIIENKHDNVLLFQSLEYLSFSLHWGENFCVFFKQKWEFSMLIFIFKFQIEKWIPITYISQMFFNSILLFSLFWLEVTNFHSKKKSQNWVSINFFATYRLIPFLY